MTSRTERVVWWWPPRWQPEAWTSSSSSWWSTTTVPTITRTTSTGRDARAEQATRLEFYMIVWALYCFRRSLVQPVGSEVLFYRIRSLFVTWTTLGPLNTCHILFSKSCSGSRATRTPSSQRTRFDMLEISSKPWSCRALLSQQNWSSFGPPLKTNRKR